MHSDRHIMSITSSEPQTILENRCYLYLDFTDKKLEALTNEVNCSRSHSYYIAKPGYQGVLNYKSHALKNHSAIREVKIVT